MKRNINNQYSIGMDIVKNNSKLALTVDDMIQFLDAYHYFIESGKGKDSVWDIIQMAYCVGLANGTAKAIRKEGV